MSTALPLHTLTNLWRFDTIAGVTGGGATPPHLRFATCYGEPSQVKEFLIFFNGRNEFIEKYTSLPEDLQLGTERGFLTWDHRGQGASQGQRSHIDSYETFARDAQRIIDHQVSFTTPYTILAHSMGGLIALYGIMKQYFRPQRLIITSPLLGVPNHPLPRFLSRPLASLLSSVGMSKKYINSDRYPRDPVATNPLTHDFAKYLALQNGIHSGRSITFGWLRATFAALEFVFSEQALQQFDVPVYMLTAEHEEVVDPLGAAKFSSRLKQIKPQQVICEQLNGALHELLFEEKHLYQKALEKVRHWL